MSINADWEKFMGGPIRAMRSGPHITISRRGVISFNKMAFDMIGKPEAVTLFYNRREQKIGMKGASPRFSEAFPVIASRPAATTRTVLAMSFLKHYGISVTETHKFLRPDLIGDRMLVLNLNETVIVSRVRDRKKA